MATHLSLKQLLSDNFNISPTRKQADALIDHCIRYELRDDNPLAFNTPMLGVVFAHFLDRDQSAVFDIFNIDRYDFEKVVFSCKSVNRDFKVRSDIYNILTVWLVYCFIKSDLPEKTKKDAGAILFRLLHYKFFTSIIKHNFPHKAREDVMQATIDGLSAKFEIKNPETPTWKEVLRVHSEELFDRSSIHYHSLQTFAPDDKVLYVISDLQTRLKAKIKPIQNEYYLNHEKGISVKSVDPSTINKEGEKELQAIKATLDAPISSITTAALNTNRFINHEYINLICKLNSNVRPDMVRDMLVTFSNMASKQYKSHEQMSTIEEKHRKIYVGYQALITEIIQKTYRQCILDGVDISKRLAIVEKTRNMYRSSRLGDEDIGSVKDSVEYFVMNNTAFKREATIASLKLAFILYIIVMTFEVR